MLNLFILQHLVVFADCKWLLRDPSADHVNRAWMDGQRCANTMRRHRHPPQLRDNRFMFCRPLIFHFRSEDFLRKSGAFDKIINDINGMQRERRREGLGRRDLSCFVEWCEATRRRRGETLLIIRLTSCSINFLTQLFTVFFTH